MTIQEMRDKRNKLLHDAQAIVTADSVTAEQRTQVTAMLADVDVIEADIAVLDRTSKAEGETRRQSAPPRGNPGADLSDPEAAKTEQKRAMTNFVRRGVMSEHLENRTVVGITTGTAGSGDLGVGGGAIVPQAFDDVLHEAQLAWGDLLNIVRVVRSDNGAPMKYATVNDTSVTWYEETENVADLNTAENPTFTGALLSTSVVQRPAILVSLAELQDSAFDIDAFMKNTIGKSYFRGLSSMIVNGSTSGNIASILGLGSASGCSVTATGVIATMSAGTVSEAATTGAIGYNDIAAIYAKLDPAYEANASWVFNSSTRGALIGVTDALGRPLYVPAPTANAFDTLLGRPVKLVQAMPSLPTATTTGVYPLLYGDFNEGYTLKLVNPGLVILRATERYIDSLSVGFIPFFRAGGVTIDAGTHPVLGLKVAHS
jgi:HK97 family phage major capsid protein